MTMFSNLESILDLAKWAHFLANGWGKWVNEFWDWTLGWIALDLTPGARFQVTMAIFIILMIAGCQFSHMSRKENEVDASIGWQNVVSRNVGIAVLMFSALSLFVYFTPEITFMAKLPPWGWAAYAVVNYVVYALCIVVGLARWPRFSAFSVAVAMVIMSIVFQTTAASLEAQHDAMQVVSFAIGTGFAILSGVVVLAMAPPRAFTN
jgi:cytochrome b561